MNVHQDHIKARKRQSEKSKNNTDIDEPLTDTDSNDETISSLDNSFIQTLPTEQSPIQASSMEKLFRQLQVIFCKEQNLKNIQNIQRHH